VEDNIEAMYSNLMNDYNHGYNIQYSGSGSGWTLYLSDGEVLSRLIYGECTYAGTGYSAQRAAIAWVVRNRMDYPGTRFPSTARGVAIRSGEFAVISGTTTDTANARLNIGKSTTAWSEATLYACTILCTTGVDMNGYLVKPTGITTQKFFLSKGSWNASYNAVNQTVNNNAVTDISQYVGNLSANAQRNIFFNFVNI